MQQILVIEVICYIALMLVLGKLAARGRMTENLFAVLLIAPIDLIILTAGIDANLSAPTPYPFGLIAVSLAAIIVAVVGYPLANGCIDRLFRASS